MVHDRHDILDRPGVRGLGHDWSRLWTLPRGSRGAAGSRQSAALRIVRDAVFHHGDAEFTKTHGQQTCWAAFVAIPPRLTPAERPAPSRPSVRLRIPVPPF